MLHPLSSPKATQSRTRADSVPSVTRSPSGCCCVGRSGVARSGWSSRAAVAGIRAAASRWPRQGGRPRRTLRVRRATRPLGRPRPVLGCRRSREGAGRGGPPPWCARQRQAAAQVTATVHSAGHTVDDPVEQTDHRISGGPMRPATGSTGSSGSELRRNPRLTTSISRGSFRQFRTRVVSLRAP
jgi:hypothetical protein